MEANRKQKMSLQNLIGGKQKESLKTLRKQKDKILDKGNQSIWQKVVTSEKIHLSFQEETEIKTKMVSMVLSKIRENIPGSCRVCATSATCKPQDKGQ